MGAMLGGDFVFNNLQPPAISKSILDGETHGVWIQLWSYPCPQRGVFRFDLDIQVCLDLCVKIMEPSRWLVRQGSKNDGHFVILNGLPPRDPVESSETRPKETLEASWKFGFNGCFSFSELRFFFFFSFFLFFLRLVCS